MCVLIHRHTYTYTSTYIARKSIRMVLRVSRVADGRVQHTNKLRAVMLVRETHVHFLRLILCHSWVFAPDSCVLLCVCVCVYEGMGAEGTRGAGSGERMEWVMEGDAETRRMKNRRKRSRKREAAKDTGHEWVGARQKVRESVYIFVCVHMFVRESWCARE